MTYVEFIDSIVKGDKEALEYAKNFKSYELNRPDWDYRLPLEEAIKKQNWPLAEELIRLGADPSTSLRTERLLTRCLERKELEGVKFLLSHNVKISYRTDLKDAMSLALQHGYDEDLVDSLFDNFQKNASAEESRSEILIPALVKSAIQEKDFKSAEYLSHKAAGLSFLPLVLSQLVVSDTPLISMILEGDIATVSFLLGTVDIDERDREGFTPLMVAINKSSRKMIQVLLKHVDTNQKNNDGKTALHIAISKVPANPEIIIELLKAGANLYATDDALITPIDIAVKKGDKAILDVIEQFSRSKLGEVKEKKEAQEVIHNFEKRIKGLFSPPFMTDSLLGHINNDHRLKGRTLQSNAFRNTALYTHNFLDSILSNKIETLTGLSSEDSALIQKASDHFKMFVEFDKEISETLDKGVNNKGVALPPDELAGLIDKNTEQILNKFDAKTDSLYIPGGWQTRGGGHAMVYGLKRAKNGDILIEIYNSGSGNEFHESKEIGNKQKSNSVMLFTLPKNKEDNLKQIIKAMVEPQILPFVQRKAEDAKKLYSDLMATIRTAGGEISSAEHYQYITGQRSGTCTWKSLSAVLKNMLPPPLFKKVKIEIKFQSILDAFKTAHTMGRLSDQSLQDELKDAIGNLSTLIQKPEEQKKAPVSARLDYKKYKPYEHMIEALNDITAALDNEKPKSELHLQIPSLADLKKYDIGPTFSENITKKPSTAPSFSEAYSSLSRESTSYTYSPGQEFNDPKEDLTVLENNLKIFDTFPESEGLILKQKAIESFFLQIPLDPKYWGAEDRASSIECTKKIGNLQRTYAAIFAKHPFHSYAAYPLTIGTIEAVQKCMKL